MVRGALIVVVLAACGPRVHHDPLPDLDDDAVPVLPPEEPPRPEPPQRPTEPPLVAAAEPPARCEGRGWDLCLGHATDLLASGAADAEAGMQLLRASCEEGDRRRCFERDLPLTALACLADNHAQACHQLALLYEEGRAACPPDLDCAAMLEEMACIGGIGDACR